MVRLAEFGLFVCELFFVLGLRRGLEGRDDLRRDLEFLGLDPFDGRNFVAGLFSFSDSESGLGERDVAS